MVQFLSVPSLTIASYTARSSARRSTHQRAPRPAAPGAWSLSNSAVGSRLMRSVPQRGVQPKLGATSHQLIAINCLFFVFNLWRLWTTSKQNGIEWDQFTTNSEAKNNGRMFHLSVIKVQLEDAASNHKEGNHEKQSNIGSFSSSPYIYQIYFLYIYSGSTLTVIHRKINTIGKK